MAQAPELDFAAFVEQRKWLHAGGSLSDGRDYAYVSDRQTRATFERFKPIELAVAASVRMFKQLGKNQFLGSSVKVSERQFPRLHGLVKTCANTLQIATPAVYIVNNPSLNAATYGTTDDAYIFVHSALVDHYSDEELLCVIGHECGHIHNSHVVYLTALHYLTQMASIFVRWAVEPAVFALRAWSRRAEITCDRAGMLCSGSEAVAQRSLAKLALGSRKLYEELDLEVFLEQYEEGKEGLGRYMEAFSTHPWLPKRILAMREFGKSSLFRKHAGLGLDGSTMEEVDTRVKSILQGDA
jgi:Zn-dependent protease with chaperone function